MGSTATSALLLVVVYISRICFRRPNPPPQNHEKHDRLMARFGAPVLVNVREWVFLLLGAVHVYLAWEDEPPPLVCPNPNGLNGRNISLSPWVIGWSSLAIASGTLRIMAFRQLGQNFTFELAQPKKLITTGIYSYMQHPSYLPDNIITVANIALFGSIDGWVGCWTDRIVPRAVVAVILRYEYLNLFLFGVLHAYIMLNVRVRDEEQMLKRTFGKEWEDWHKKTARFIPGVF